MRHNVIPVLTRGLKPTATVRDRAAVKDRMDRSAVQDGRKLKSAADCQNGGQIDRRAVMQDSRGLQPTETRSEGLCRSATPD